MILTHPMVQFLGGRSVKRTSYEKENFIIATKKTPNAWGGIYKTELENPYVVKTIENFNTKFSVGLSLADREEMAKKVIEDWEKNGETDIHTMSAKSAIQCFALEDIFYKRSDFAKFIQERNADATWLLDKVDHGFLYQSPLPSEPNANLAALRDYAAYRICQVNIVAGYDFVPLIPSVKAQVIDRTVKQWGSLSKEKQKEILDGTKLFAAHQNLWEYKLPTLAQYQAYLWGQELVKSAPELKPFVDRRAAYFKNLASKDSQWKAKADGEQKKLDQSIVQMQGEYLRGQTSRMKSAMDDLVKSGNVLRMNILENTKSAPNEIYWYLKRINP